MWIVSIIGMLATPLIFLTNGGRVCSGWKMLTIQKSKDLAIDFNTYLIKRGAFFLFFGFMGIGFLFGFLFMEYSRRKIAL